MWLCVLWQACIDENAEMVQFLVESGSDVNRGDNEGWTPLHAAASCGFIQITKWVLTVTTLTPHWLYNSNNSTLNGPQYFVSLGPHRILVHLEVDIVQDIGIDNNNDVR